MFAASAPDSYLPFTSCLLDQTHTILSACPCLSGFLTAYQPSSLFWALLSPCLELNMLFQLNHCQRGMENNGSFSTLHAHQRPRQALTSVFSFQFPVLLRQDVFTTHLSGIKTVLLETYFAAFPRSKV